MTDNDIIKALELCFNPNGTTSCSECPYHKFRALCKVERNRDALDLINRLQKDKEYYKNNRNEYQDKVMFISKQCDELQEENSRQKAEKEALIAGQETLQKYIAEQKAEIERLRIEKDNLIKTYKECMTEAITEFAERLKLRVEGIPWCECKPVQNAIDELAKEMKEGE